MKMVSASQSTSASPVGRMTTSCASGCCVEAASGAFASALASSAAAFSALAAASSVTGWEGEADKTIVRSFCAAAQDEAPAWLKRARLQLELLPVAAGLSRSPLRRLRCAIATLRTAAD